MTKQEQFLYVVQTAILANAVNIASNAHDDPAHVGKYRHEISASGVIGLMHDVLWASERIPAEMGPVEAANEFVSYIVSVR